MNRHIKAMTISLLALVSLLCLPGPGGIEGVESSRSIQRHRHVHGLRLGHASITKWAAGRTKSTADFYTVGGGITGFQNGLAIAGDYSSPQQPCWV